MQSFSINFCKRCYEDLNSKNNKANNKKYCDECLKSVNKDNKEGDKNDV